jgi:subtilisin family serine protease
MMPLEGSSAMVGIARYAPRSALASALALGLLAFSSSSPEASTSIAPVLPVSIVEDVRLDPRIGTILSASTPLAAREQLVPEGFYGIPVLIGGDVRRGDLEALGIVVGTQAGGVTTAEVPPEAFGALLATPGLVGVEAARKMDLLLNVSAPVIQADECWGDPSAPYAPPYPGWTGLNVIVGIVDTGIDLAHADFRKINGWTRVKYLWDQTRVGTQPAGFTYGAEWTEGQINQNQTTQTDTDGHGTHLAGLAAGNGRATGQGFSAFRYVGIAPEADLVVVKSYLTDDKIIDGVNYVFQKAAALGKDAVVLVAVGHQRGAHDGTHYLDTALSALTGAGKLIVAAAGNASGQPIHASANVSSGATVTTNLSVPVHAPNAGINEYAEIEGWHGSTASFDVKLTSPSNFTTNWVTPGTQSSTITGSDGAFFVQNAVETNSKGAKKVRVYMYESGAYTPRAGTWKIDFKRRSGTTSGVFDAWVSNWYFDSGADSVEFTSNVVNGSLVVSPATADSVIGIGAFTTKTSWVNVTGATSFYVGAPAPGAIADFSSPGPRRDGVQRPDLCAPGYGVMGALSISVSGSTSNTWKAEDGVHRIRKGTSAAVAHAAGALALLLEQTPDLKPTGARNLLRQRAASDFRTGAVPNAVWGYGKMNIVGTGALVGVDATAGPSPAEPRVFPNPARGPVQFEFALSREDVASAAGPVALRILDVQGREVARVVGSSTPGAQRLTWSGRSSGGAPAAPGVYFARLDFGDTHAAWKFVRIR